MIAALKRKMTLFVFSSKGIVSFNFVVSNLSNGANNCGTLILLIIFFFHCIVAGCVRESDIIVFTSCNLCTCLLRPGGGWSRIRSSTTGDSVYFLCEAHSHPSKCYISFCSFTFLSNKIGLQCLIRYRLKFWWVERFININGTFVILCLPCELFSRP